MTIFDTDVLIWTQRGNNKAANLIQKANPRLISIQTYMELLQCANSKKQYQFILSFLHDFDFEIMPFSENIGHRAAIYIKEYSICYGIQTGDAIIAAIAIENNKLLISSNKKHFKYIPNLEFKSFTP